MSHKIQKILFVATVGISFSVSANNYEVEKLMDSYMVAKADAPNMTDEEIKATPYTIQVASYINEKDAVSYVEELKLHEKEVYYFPAFVRGQVWFKVCVGKFASKGTAEDYKKSFVKRMDEPFATVISLLDRPSQEKEKSSEASKVVQAKPVAPVELVAAPVEKPATPVEAVVITKPVPMIPAMAEVKTTFVRSPASVAATEEVTYGLQVGAYPSEDLAKQQIEKLDIKDQSVYYQQADVNGKTWYRLFVGKFKTKVEAEGYQKAYQEKSGGAESLVRKVK